MPGRGHIYLDNNATTPVVPEVVQAMLPWLERDWGNPSSGHRFGAAPREGLAQARARAAELLGARPEEIVFTGSGTESDVAALLGTARARRRATGADRVIATAVEHPAVMGALRVLSGEGFVTEFLPVDADGLLDPAVAAERIDERTALVSVMLANNETGAVLPVAEVARAAHAHGVPLHSDAVNAAGKWPVRVDETGADLLALAAHKFHGPRGVGLLYIRRGTPFEALLPGGGQEHGMRSGTENVAGIAGMVRALELATSDLDATRREMARLSTRLLDGLRSLRPDLLLNGPVAPRLPNTLNVCFPATGAAELARRLDEQGVAVSTGAACHDAGSIGSHVLAAMGRTAEQAAGSIRISLSRLSTEDEIDRALAAFARCLDHGC